jgi:predicted RNase H-like HicB family nuclease
MSDGETPADALRNIEDAIAEWLATAVELKRPIPEPTR